MKKIMLLLVITSCATIDQVKNTAQSSLNPVKHTKCNRPKLNVSPNSTWNSYDEKLIEGFHKRCAEKYGKGRCAVKVNKYKDFSYGITCKLQE